MIQPSKNYLVNLSPDIKHKRLENRVKWVLGAKTQEHIKEVRGFIQNCRTNYENHKEFFPKSCAVYSFFPIKVFESYVLVINPKENNQELKSQKLAKIFKDCTILGTFISTVGHGISELANESFDHKDFSVDGFVYDCIGSEYAESSASNIQKIMLEHVKNSGFALDKKDLIQKYEEASCSSLRRYSPGYGDWNIKEQKKLFSFVNGSLIGVTLSESCMMTPEKSVSAVIGYKKCL